MRGLGFKGLGLEGLGFKGLVYYSIMLYIIAYYSRTRGFRVGVPGQPAAAASLLDLCRSLPGAVPWTAETSG